MRLWGAVLVAASVVACGPSVSKAPVLQVASVDFPVLARPVCDEKLAEAATRADVGQVRQLIAEGKTPNCGSDGLPTLLSDAILNDRVDVVRALLDGKADPNLRWGGHGDRLPVQDVIEGGALFGMR